MKITNKRARADYILHGRVEAGISLTGQEASAIAKGRIDLSRAYAKIIGREAFLINALVPEVKEPKRTRKLLLHKSQLLSLETKIKQQKLTLIPLSIYTKRRLIKLELALAKTRQKHEKKEALKQRDIERETRLELKNY